MTKNDTQKQGLVPQIKKEKDALSKLQKQFNTKINRINKLKATIAENEAVIAELRKKVQEELVPLSKELTEGRIAFVNLLDKAYEGSFFRKREKEKLAMLIEDLSFSLIEDEGREELIPLHDKYAAFSHAEVVEQAEEEAKEQAQDLFQDFFGLDIDLDNFDDLEGLQEQLRQQMEAQEQARQQQKAKRKKTKAQEAKEEALKTEMSNIAKASRRIYTDLAKMLHPDREQDQEQRAWKEEVMKKVTAAYTQNDFFELLRLQMEFMQEKGDALHELPEQQLKYYLKLLNEQLKELEFEREKLNFGPDGTLLFQFGGTPKLREQRFKAEKTKLKQHIKRMRDDLKHFAEPENLRYFLKSVR
ncbi:J domain-containing protein [Botryobacter ruber]|uniref:J domain-containing protein n=1 Tax=Botryobacter ruber TaxID=2171629 RepID=UPI000E0CBE91|nr:J domain-containing protein [Botryobacter ruber]